MGGKNEQKTHEFPLHLTIVLACVVIRTLKSLDIVTLANVNVCCISYCYYICSCIGVHVPTNVHVVIIVPHANVVMWMLILVHLLMC